MSGGVVVGIDPGVTGAFAVVETEGGKLLDCKRVVSEESGFGGRVKRHVSPGATLSLLKESIGGRPVDLVCIERVGPRDKNPPVTFSLGDSFGVMRALADLITDRVILPRPQDWQPRVTWTKDHSRALAALLNPEQARALSTKGSHDLADAMLLAEHGRRVAVGSIHLLEGVDNDHFPL